VPSIELPPDVLLTDQLTAVLVVLLTVAVNCFVPSTITEAVVGEIEISTDAGGVVDVLPPPPPQEDRKREESAAVASTVRTGWF
jgi:hypothetical protein